MAAAGGGVAMSYAMQQGQGQKPPGAGNPPYVRLRENTSFERTQSKLYLAT
jgi:hypothetical protein